MKFSRRKFLTAGLAAGGVAIGSLISGSVWRVRGSGAASLTSKDFKALTDFALSEAGRLGCAYADVRIGRRRDGSIARIASKSPPCKGGEKVGVQPKGKGSVSAEIESEWLTFAVRVVHSNGWGYAKGSTLTKEGITRAITRAVANARADATLKDRPVTIIPRAARKDSWIGRHEPYETQLGNQLASLVARNNDSPRTFAAAETFFVSSKGAFGHSSTLSVA